MNRELIDWLACPQDGSYPLELDASDAAAGRVEEGALRCPSCGARYPIAEGIAIFLPRELPELQRLEKDAREREYGGGEKYESEVQRLPELDAVRRALGDPRGLHVLDAGCGTGDVTEILRSAARIVATDFSWAGLTAHRLKGSAAVDLIQGDISRLPFRGGVFDAAISTGALQHLTSRELRSAFLGHLARTMKPGGRLVLTTFNWNAYDRGKGIPKEGFFDNGIFRRRFEPEELRSELAQRFDVEAIVPVQIFPPKTYGLVEALGRRNVAWDRFWRRFPWSTAYGNLLLASCRKR